MKSLLTVFFALLIASYPFVVLFGLDRLGISALGLLLLAVLLLRFVAVKSLSKNQQANYKQANRKEANRKQTLLLVVMTVFCLGVVISDSELLLRFYPVIMSLAMASIFFASLFAAESLVERFARLAGNEIDDTVKSYTRNVTKIWVVALLLNALVALYTVCCVSLTYWTYYNGFISYLLFGLLITVEFVYRYFYKKRHHKE